MRLLSVVVLSMLTACKTPTPSTQLKGSCSDGKKNGTEVDVDCGGDCSRCAAGKRCGTGNDCTDKSCAAGFCAVASCADGIKNGGETDVDCGGSICPGCAIGKSCSTSSDCEIGKCDAFACISTAAPQIAWNGIPTLSTSCDLSEPATITLDTAHSATIVDETGVVPIAASVVADSNGLSAKVPAPVVGAFDTTLGVTDSFHGHASIEQDVSFNIISRGQLTSPVIPILSLGGDGMTGRQVFWDSVPLAQACTTFTGTRGSLAIASDAACALLSSGGISCWGARNWGGVGDGVISSTPALNPTPVCDGTASCGAGSGNVLGAVEALAGGESHFCALLSSGNLKCWGAGYSGELGDGSSGLSDIQPNPVDVCLDSCDGTNRLSDVVSVSAGFAHTCAVLGDGSVRCWGADGSGQLGDGTTGVGAGEANNIRVNPVAVCLNGPVTGTNAIDNIVAVSAGTDHTCALTSAGTVKCWGNDLYGQLGDGTTGTSTCPAGNCRLNPVDVCTGGPCTGSNLLTNIISISAGQNFTCALTNTGNVWCWGDDEYGQLGDGTYGISAGGTLNTNVRLSPVNVCVGGPCTGNNLLSNIAAITTGVFYACALTSSGNVKCWGANAQGELGNGAKGEIEQTPVDVCGSGSHCLGTNLLDNLISVAAGGATTCALDNGGAVHCWGDDTAGQLGDGETGPPADHSVLNPDIVCNSPGHAVSVADCIGGPVFSAAAVREFTSFAVTLP